MTITGPLDLDAARARIDRAHRMVGDIAAGTTWWKMSIPAREDTDSDLVLATALADAEKAVAELEAARFVGATLREIHHEHGGRCMHCVEWCDCLDHDDAARVADCAHGNVAWPCLTIKALDKTAGGLAPNHVGASASNPARASVLVIYADDPDADGGDRDA